MLDLHMHSAYSGDGEFSPTALIEKCANAGVTTLSVTDHNTVRATEEAAAAAKARGLIYLSGIEIDCVYENVNFHVLGYGVDHRAPSFQQIETQIRSQGAFASRRMLEETNALGFSVTEDDLRALMEGSYWPETFTGELFAEYLLSAPAYQKHTLLAPYRPGGARGDNPYVNFYWDFYAQGKPCYVPIRYPAMQDVVATIHEAGGLAVLAHPHVNLKGNAALLDGVMALGLDGIEAFSSYHTPEQAACSLADAHHYQVLATCGSDFHGKTKPAIALGRHGCPLPEATMQTQLERLLQKAI